MLKITDMYRFIRYMRFHFCDICRERHLPENMGEWEGYCVYFGITEKEYDEAAEKLTGWAHATMGDVCRAIGARLKNGEALPKFWDDAVYNLADWAEANNTDCGVVIA